jgi:hypothetical protein
MASVRGERENWNLTVDWILTAEAPTRSERPAKSPRRRQPQQIIKLNRSLYSAAHRSGRVSSSATVDDRVDDLRREPAP